MLHAVGDRAATRHRGDLRAGGDLTGGHELGVLRLLLSLSRIYSTVILHHFLSLIQ